MAPIFLPNAFSTQSSDDAGILITKTVLPRYEPGPYTPSLLPDHLKTPDELRHVPPLAYFCIKPLIQNVDAFNFGGCPRIQYTESHLHVIKSFIAFFDSETTEEDMVFVDPRVWAALIQSYSSLPECFNTYHLPLSDTHLTMLQAIPSTPDFTLVTVLDLSSRLEIDDISVGYLKPLTNLCVLDLSRTQVGSWGVRKLSMCLVRSGRERRGPWGLRVWSLRGCRRVDDSVKHTLSKFPLLSAIDLRETSINSLIFEGFICNPPLTHAGFYYPNPPLSWLPAISKLFRECRLFEAESRPHVLHIDRLHHPRYAPLRAFSPPGTKEAEGQDRVVALLPRGGQALHTTHSLAQTAEKQTANRRQQAFRQGDHGHERYFEHAEYGRPYSPDSYSNDDNSVDLFGLSYHPFYRDTEDELGINLPLLPSRDSEVTMRVAFDEAAQRRTQNQVAAFLNAREISEREARNFYAKAPLERAESAFQIRGGALPNQVSLAGRDGIPRTPRLLNKTDEDRRRNLMFFRIPPRFDSIPDTQPMETAKRKNSDTEVVSMKRRKAAMITSASSKALWNHRRMRAHSAPGNKVYQENEGPTGSPALHLCESTAPVLESSSGHSKTLNYTVTQVSINPFLAKKTESSWRHGPVNPTLVDLSSFTFSSGSSGLMSPSTCFAGATDKCESEAEPSATKTQKNKGELRLETGQRAQGNQRVAAAFQGFDLKAWATRAKKV